MRYVILNTETTGLYPMQGDRMVELSAVEICNRHIGQSFHTYINPGFTIPDASVRIHGISNSDVHDAPAFAKITPEFLDFIKGGTLVIHNAPFDLRFIVNELALAEELALPIVVLSQLCRCVENRLDKRPMLSDIPCFPTLEQHADVMMFLYRHEVYEQRPCHEGMAEIIVAKHRNGATGTVPLTFNRACCRFENR